MKFYGRLLALLMVVICLSVLAILPASAKTSVTEHGTSEFFGGFTSRGDSRWTIKDGALVNGASGKAGRSVMAFDAQIDGTKSFKYDLIVPSTPRLSRSFKYSSFVVCPSKKSVVHLPIEFFETLVLYLNILVVFPVPFFILFDDRMYDHPVSDVTANALFPPFPISLPI